MNRITVGLDALAKSLIKRTPQSAVILYPDRSGHVVTRISKDEEQIVFSFQEPAELFAWLMADLETRAAMSRKAKARSEERSNELGTGVARSRQTGVDSVTILLANIPAVAMAALACWAIAYGHTLLSGGLFILSVCFACFIHTVRSHDSE